VLLLKALVVAVNNYLKRNNGARILDICPWFLVAGGWPLADTSEPAATRDQEHATSDQQTVFF
jgi:hypothetical protein